jgi:small ligand-binding sensory domain FIST
MTCASALSTERDPDRAVHEVLDRVSSQLADAPADLSVAFVSPHHAGALQALAGQVRDRGLARHLIGCTGEAIVGEDREVEGAPAVSLWAIRLPGATVEPIRMASGPRGGDDLEAAILREPQGERFLIVLGEPFTFPTDPWLRSINESLPGLRVIGGMASAGQRPGENRLVLDDRVFEDGAVGALLDGPLRIRTVVSQGCRPIGRPMIVTRAAENVIQELGRRPALDVLQETYENLDAEEQELVRGGLHIGRVINEYQGTFGRGDFLVRNVIGFDEAGALVITDRVRVGVTVQFHVRDAATADEDLRSLLSETSGNGRVRGALLFTCNGRGTRLFPRPNHDVTALRDEIGPVPVAGFFAMGEIGPIGGQNFVHGFTASVALFEEKP